MLEPKQTEVHLHIGEGTDVLTAIVVRTILPIVPLLQPPFPPECELEVLTPIAIEERAVVEFSARVETYLTLQRRLARTLPPLEMFDEDDPFVADELRRVVVAARPGARPGDFFTPGVAETLRRRIDVALINVLIHSGGSAVPFGPSDFADAGRAVVNRPLPVLPDPIAWAPLISALPPLAPELIFVIWRGDLALVDVAANLVLDVLIDVVPEWPAQPAIYR